jgi:hypothetical protein
MLIKNGEATSVYPQLFMTEAKEVFPQLYKTSQNTELIAAETMRIASRCDTNQLLFSKQTQNKMRTPPQLVGFTTNPLFPQQHGPTDFGRLVSDEVAAGGNIKLVQLVRTNFVKQGMSFITKMILKTCYGRANLGPKQAELRCEKGKLFPIEIGTFAAIVAGEAQLRIDFDRMIASLGRDVYVVEYEMLQADKDREMQALFTWMQVPDLFNAGEGRFVKKNDDDLRHLVENFDELRVYLQQLALPDDVCPLLQMLETANHTHFPRCDHAEVVRRIQKSAVYKNDPKANGLFRGLVFSGGKGRNAGRGERKE